ncbi:mCG145334, partial [Mus musculus]
ASGEKQKITGPQEWKLGRFSTVSLQQYKKHTSEQKVSSHCFSQLRRFSLQAQTSPRTRKLKRMKCTQHLSALGELTSIEEVSGKFDFSIFYNSSMCCLQR